MGASFNSRYSATVIRFLSRLVMSSPWLLTGLTNTQMTQRSTRM